MRYFVVSDLHSYYAPLIKALEEKGFNQEEDTLIVCGDVFDRGDETIEVYEFLKSIPHKILIRGNHEWLYKELLKKKYPDNHDYSNGTVKTFCSIADIDDKKMDRKYYFIQNALFGTNFKYNEEIPKLWHKVYEKVKDSEITKWIESDEWINYFELKDYVFVHSWIPVIDHDNLPSFFVKNRNLEYIPNWREITDQSLWDSATWGSPVENYKNGLWKEDKTLVVGHWYSNLFHKEFEHSIEDNFDIYYGDKIIALDACTPLSNQINVLVIEE